MLGCHLGSMKVHVVSFKMPVQRAQPMEAEGRSSLQSKAVRKRDLFSLLLEKAKRIFSMEKS